MLLRTGVALIPLIAKIDLLNCFGGHVFWMSGVGSGLTFSLSNSSTVPMPTDGGGPGVFVARNAGVLMRRLDDRFPSGSLGMDGVEGRAHFGGGNAGV